LDHNDTDHDSLEYIEGLSYLEMRLIHVKQQVEHADEPEMSKKPCRDVSISKIAELYRLAGLIYLYRAGKRCKSNNSNLKLLVESGFKIAAGLDACPRAFPVVILGCEAHCDSDRLIILDLLRRTQGCRKIGDISGAQKLIEAWWAQDDLFAGEGLDYAKKLDAIMSLSKHRPSLAVSLMGGSFLPAT
jgi:Fungal specific transcription factor domain